MGTNAVPFLVREAFTFRPDRFPRTNLYQLFLELPEWAGRGAFTPYSVVQHEATRSLRALRPPADVLLPWLQPQLESTNQFHARQALFLLGTIGPGGEFTLPRLLRFATNSTDSLARNIAWQSIRLMGVRASNALPAVLELIQPTVASNRMASAFLDWIAELGPAAATAVPTLESILGSTTDDYPARVRTAVALVSIDPANEAAWRMLTHAADLSSRDADAADISRIPLCEAVSRAPRRPHPGLAALIEPLARLETSTWSPRGASFRAVSALERIGPDRAKILYESLLDQPGVGVLHAASGLLRVDPNHEAATRLLIEAIPAGRNTGAMPLWALGYASSSNRLAIAALEEVVSGRHGPSTYFQQYTPVEQAKQEARIALGRIRYREARAARGLPEGEWW